MAKRIGIPSDSKETFYFENLVLVELLRRKAKVHYWQSEAGIEIDFVVETNDQTRQLIQVAWSVENSETLKRELQGFQEFKAAHKGLRIDQQIIITFTGHKSHVDENIIVIPFYLWALL